MDRAIKMGLDPGARREHFEDLAVRDLVSYLALWFIGVCILIVWAQRRVTDPVYRLERILKRVTDGDLSTDIPSPGQGEMQRLTLALKEAIERFEQNAALFTPQNCRANAERFSIDRYHSEMIAFFQNIIA